MSHREMASTFPDEKHIVKAIYLIGTLTTETTRFISETVFPGLKKMYIIG